MLTTLEGKYIINNIMLITEEIYHLINRGTDSRIIFKNTQDYERFLLTLLECNNVNNLYNVKHRNRRHNKETINTKEIQRFVEILCISLLPNHFHIVVKQLVDGGISKLMQRVGNSYTKYFNIKNSRKGSLFMSRYKSVHVNTDTQIRHLITYVHANPLDLITPEWRNGEIQNHKKAKEFLENYKWSSYLFYSKGNGLDLISQIISREMVDIFYPYKKDHFKEIYSWSGRYFEE